jgi:beta-galactosidase
MRKYSFLFVVYLFLAHNKSFAQQKINFDEDWKFHLGNASNPEKDFNYGIANIFAKTAAEKNTPIDLNFSDSNWRSLNVPHDWAVELPFQNSENFDVESHGFKPVGGQYPENSIGWYRKKFTINKRDIGQRFYLQFDGIFRNANIWVNGFFVGNNMSGYVGAMYDVTDFLQSDKENIITVRVDATQYEGWFYEGAGIYRHVWLLQKDNVHIENGGKFIYTEVQNNKAIVHVDATVENKNDKAENASIYSFIATRDGKFVAQVSEQKFTIAANEKVTIKQKINIANPHLWDIEDPYLYRVITVLSVSNKILETTTEKIGIRTFRFDANEGFFLNGKHVKIKGTNNHQDHAGLGAALPDAINYYRIELLKKMGCNAYRTSHHAPTPELLDACDSLGMLVMDEQRNLNSSEEYLNQFERLVKRDRNHASVFMWSIGNEEGWIHTTPIGKKVAQTFITKQKYLDPTRTCTYAADVANVFDGVNEVIPIRGFNYRQFAVADYHKDHPTQPVIGTEMGSTVTTRGIYVKDTINAYVPDQDITYPWWASTAETWWKLAAENKYWLGGFIWTGFDYRGEPTPYRWPNINSHFGVMDMCGFPKNIYYYYKSWWTNDDVLHISPHWNWKESTDSVDVWVNSNAENVELLLNGKTLGKKVMPRNGHLQWKVKYEAGRLEAIANKNDRKITNFVETTGKASKLKLEPYKKLLLANGMDATVVNVTVLDSDGREVPDYNGLIHFTIDGAAKIIGVGNGDPSSHEPDKCDANNWQRSTFNGKCQLMIQSTKQLGTIKLTANNAALVPAETEMQTIMEAK